MSLEYPCVHHVDGKCKLLSDDESISFCVYGPCRYETPSNGDRIRAMSDEELAEFLSGIAYGRKTPWSLPFAEKFCKNCPTTTCTIEGYHHPMELHECDFVDGKCPHGSDIVWWLQQPAEDADNEV